MERGEVSKVLPADLVEKIVAMIPFPYIFKAKTLSKAWLARFSPTSSLGNKEEEKLLATSFQNHVANSSSKWPTFSPVCTTDEDLFGYDQASRKWQRLPSSLPLPDVKYISHLEIEGALLYGFHDLERYKREPVRLLAIAAAVLEKKPLAALPNASRSICVANILTMEWKQLPPLPDDCQSDVYCLKLVNNTSLGTYKVIAVCQDYHPQEERDHFYIHSYDSKSETWSSIKFFSSPSVVEWRGVEDSASTAYLNGFLYMVQEADWAVLSAFNVEEGSLEELTLLKDDEMEFDGDDVILAVFNGSLVMIMTDVDGVRIHVLQIDLKLQRVREVAQCELNAFQDIINRPISQTDCLSYKLRRLYTTQQHDSNLLLTYDQQKNAWSFFSFPVANVEVSFPKIVYSQMIVSSFQPSLNPFMAV